MHEDDVWALVKAGLVVAALIVGALWGWPQYSVWQRNLQGQAELAQAQSNRKIAVLEAEAKKESAKALAEAEVERAKGVARSVREVGGALEDNPQYLRYLWVTGLSDGHGETVYIPTEAGMPILEAGKRGVKSERAVPVKP